MCTVIMLDLLTQEQHYCRRGCFNFPDYNNLGKKTVGKFFTLSKFYQTEIFIN